MKENKKNYHCDFKAKAVMLSFEKGTISKVAEELNISSRSLFHWRKNYIIYGAGSFSGLGKTQLIPQEKKIYDLEKKKKKKNLKLLKVPEIILIKGSFLLLNL